MHGALLNSIMHGAHSAVGFKLHDKKKAIPIIARLQSDIV